MDVNCVNTMHEELNNFTRNQVWELVETKEPQYDWNQMGL